MKETTHVAADAGGVVGPDVVAACALSSVPGIGASTLARIAEAFGTLSDAMEAGPSRILKRAEEIGLELRQDAHDFLSRKPDLEHLGTWAEAGIARSSSTKQERERRWFMGGGDSESRATSGGPVW